ncbi:hypothetical protein OG298_45170 (plasmid) [Streptomyces sp. NBC_01005]|uniref:hypothetical protein n=1 Tax=Streptomyces sp. NBC_01005 TaxID=2903715 RepID=UPI002F90F38C|nr:hypothetical protein OG298_45170 [Streptomyces sp. NBC_01005]
MSDRPEITDLYAANASPDSIHARLAKARTQRDRWQRHIEGLTRLLDTRLGQIEAGTWPTVPEETDR